MLMLPDVAFLSMVFTVKVAALREDAVVAPRVEAPAVRVPVVEREEAVVAPKVQVPDADKAPVVEREDALVAPKVQVPDAVRAPVVEREEALVAPRVEVPAARVPSVSIDPCPKALMTTVGLAMLISASGSNCDVSTR